MTREAVVIGGGIAGTATAIALRHAGFAPVIYEAHPRGAEERGAFLTLAVNGINALRALGLDPARVLARGFATPVLALHGASGRLLAELPLGGPLPDGTTTTTIRRADLHAALRAEAGSRGIPIEHGARLTAVSTTAGGATARFEDGRTVAGEILVGADGLHSRTREALDPGVSAPGYLGLLDTGGFTAGPVGAAAAPPPGVMRMDFGRRAFFGSATAPDGSVWWFANPSRRRPAEPGEFPPGAWREHLIGLLDGDQAEWVRASDQVLGPWNTQDLRRVRVWHDDRVVLAGDAAHAVAPSSGQGASMALEDAVVLGHSLREQPDVPAALAAYEAVRRPRVEKVVAHGRRSSNSKVQGPVGAAIRDAMTPLIMRLLHRNGDPQAWILEHRLPALAAL